MGATANAGAESSTRGAAEREARRPSPAVSVRSREGELSRFELLGSTAHEVLSRLGLTPLAPQARTGTSLASQAPTGSPAGHPGDAGIVSGRSSQWGACSDGVGAYSDRKGHSGRSWGGYSDAWYLALEDPRLNRWRASNGTDGFRQNQQQDISERQLHQQQHHQQPEISERQLHQEQHHQRHRWRQEEQNAAVSESLWGSSSDASQALNGHPKLGPPLEQRVLDTWKQRQRREALGGTGSIPRDGLGREGEAGVQLLRDETAGSASATASGGERGSTGCEEEEGQGRLGNAMAATPGHPVTGCPVLLVRHALGSKGRGKPLGIPRWSLICPAPWASVLWHHAVLCGGHALGLREWRAALFAVSPLLPWPFPSLQVHRTYAPVHPGCSLGRTADAAELLSVGTFMRCSFAGNSPSHLASLLVRCGLSK